MAHEEKKRKKKKKFRRWFRSLSTRKKVFFITEMSVLALLLCLLATVILYVTYMYGKLDTQEIKKDDIYVNEQLAEDSVGEGYTNIALFGGDSRTGEVEQYLNTDTIIVASLNNKTKEIKLVSVYRDTLLDVKNGKLKKCNSAYSLGGAAQAISMLNMNLDLDIQKYVTVDFGAVVELVDLLGGVEVDVSEKEWKEVNKYIEETAMVAGKKAVKLTKAGLQTLDGVQATTYARIRKNVGDDYARTERQRLLIQKIVEKVLKSDLATITSIINTLFPRISTNFKLSEILSYAKSFAKYSIGETSGFPFEQRSGTISGKGDCIYAITLESNVSQLHEFLYGTVDYQPSSKVVEISREIEALVNDSNQSTTTPNDSSGDGNGGGTDGSSGDGNGEDPENPSDGEDVEDPENPSGGGDVEDPENPSGGGNGGETDNPSGGGDGEDPENPSGGGDGEDPENPSGGGNGDGTENPTGGNTDGGADSGNSGGGGTIGGGTSTG